MARIYLPLDVWKMFRKPVEGSDPPATLLSNLEKSLDDLSDRLVHDGRVHTELQPTPGQIQTLSGPVIEAVLADVRVALLAAIQAQKWGQRNDPAKPVEGVALHPPGGASVTA